jgi:diadenosine tetraphosphatase ApaH/serine/threonine PP2A family protein phosphatase
MTFDQEPHMLDLHGDFSIIGDLHGHVLDLLRIFCECGLPPTTRYLVLGDMADRGPFSVHTTLYLLALKCCYPDSVYLIRGNHEFESVNSACGLKDEVFEIFGSKNVFAVLNSVFGHLPIAARLNDELLCVHAGIGPHFKTLDQLCSVPKQLFECYGGIADAVVWSDPIAAPNVLFKESSRGIGFAFGEKALTAFLESNSLRMLIRGHEALDDGVKFQFNGRIVTVFSASSYCGREKAFAGVLHVRESERASAFSAVPFVNRKPIARGRAIKAIRGRRPSSVPGKMQIAKR